jgi:hypothetical protein
MHEVILEEWDHDQTIDGCEWQRRWEATFSSGFGRADSEVLTEGVAPEMVGSTAVVVVLSGCQIITSNCGDSRAVLFRRTETIPLTVDQKVISKSSNAFCALFFKVIHLSVYLLSLQRILLLELISLSKSSPLLILRHPDDCKYPYDTP